MQFLLRTIEVLLIAVFALIGYQMGKTDGIAEGRNMALKEALKTNPPSEELEMACLGLWLGEQNKKHFEKENRRAR